MTIATKYANKSLSITISSEDLEFLIANGYTRGNIKYANIPVDGGTFELNISVTAQDTMKEVYAAEVAAYEAAKPKKAVPAAAPEVKEEDHGENGTDQPASATPTIDVQQDDRKLRGD